MMPPEAKSTQEGLGLGTWVSIIEARWKQIPAFKVEPERLRHLANICDGNRRSAREKGLKSWEGHRLGIEVIRGIARAGGDWGIGGLTFWTWSTENWKRGRRQIDFVMGLAARYLAEEQLIQEFCDHQVRFTHLGRKDRLPTKVKTVIEDLERVTAGFDRYRLNLALDYGGVDELARGVVRMIEAVQTGNLSSEEILLTPGIILEYLDTAGQYLPDLVVRTGAKSGEVPHNSGFLPLQSEYAGWMFLPDLFPDLQPHTLQTAISEFLGYERRFGR